MPDRKLLAMYHNSLIHHEPAHHVSPSHALSSLRHARHEKEFEARTQGKLPSHLVGCPGALLLSKSYNPIVPCAAARLRRKSLDSHLDDARARPWRRSVSPPKGRAQERTFDYSSLPELLRPNNGLPPKKQQPVVAPSSGAASAASGECVDGSYLRAISNRQSGAMDLLRSRRKHGMGLMASLRMIEEVSTAPTPPSLHSLSRTATPCARTPPHWRTHPDTLHTHGTGEAAHGGRDHGARPTAPPPRATRVRWVCGPPAR